MTANSDISKPIPAHVGIGLRYPHYRDIAEQLPPIAWLEAHSENFFAQGGMNLHLLEQIAGHYPISLHGVGLSLGSADALSKDHLKRLKWLVDYVKPGLVSEHISWSAVDGRVMNDLLPLPYTKEVLGIVSDHITQVQDFLGRQILVENPSTYLSFSASEMPEAVFMAEVAARSGCGILLDVNNIYVCHRNHGVDAREYISTIPEGVVGEIHLAGHAERVFEGQVLAIDTHGTHVIEPVWELYRDALRRFGCIPTLIEWDTHIPALSVLMDEAAKAQCILGGYHKEVRRVRA